MDFSKQTFTHRRNIYLSLQHTYVHTGVCELFLLSISPGIVYAFHKQNQICLPLANHDQNIINLDLVQETFSEVSFCGVMLHRTPFYKYTSSNLLYLSLHSFVFLILCMWLCLFLYLLTFPEVVLCTVCCQFHSFLDQVFHEHLPCARHCRRHYYVLGCSR